MKQRLTQLKARYQQYSARERQLIKACALACCCAGIWYGVTVPLDTMIGNSKMTLNRQNETLRWMREEIDKNHLQAKVVKTSNPRSVVEESAKAINVQLQDIRQEGQTLAFVIERVNVYELKNWLSEINYVAGIRLEKMALTPVDHISAVKAVITLSWQKTP